MSRGVASNPNNSSIMHCTAAKINVKVLQCHKINVEEVLKQNRAIIFEKCLKTQLCRFEHVFKHVNITIGCFLTVLTMDNRPATPIQQASGRLYAEI